VKEIQTSIGVTEEGKNQEVPGRLGKGVRIVQCFSPTDVLNCRKNWEVDRQRKVEREKQMFSIRAVVASVKKKY